METLGNAANLHWYLLWLAPRLVLSKPASLGGRLATFAASFAVALSEVIAGMFLPLALWMAWKRKSYFAPLGLVAGVALQILTTMFNPRPASLRVENSVEPASVLIGFFVQPVAALWQTDSRTLISNLNNFGGLAVLFPSALLAVLTVMVLKFGHQRWKAGAICLVAAAFSCWSASVLINANPMFDYARFTAEDWQTMFDYSRYAAAPGMFLLALIPVALSVLHEMPATRNSHFFARLQGVSSGIFALLILVSFFPATTLREDGPRWSPAVAEARENCRSGSSPASDTVTAAPALWKFARIEVPCQVLEKGPSGFHAASEGTRN
ncbi:hypothetical protein [Pseudarthrobacter sp. fls2-241-R2A-127]|uniref:hypothetical protein n=1 Tax=Pseudarthrobacter sp. fls2-241-R2A-127 TaxID=3040303 RepID=UPI0025568540|nr:hypothetical protein [Pseudarthrobacter sp. fls2-241-R2A-127]